ncbi:MAG TPA: PEGA domain-containing protein [Vicinamibacterales bacterium]|nr:PEGA domain-containing protein [Vicinamibacterales bacterium]
MSAAKSMPQEEIVFSDGLGDRLLVRDALGRPVHESLTLRSELSAIPSFEFALNERLWLVERFDHPAFVTIRNIVSEPGRVSRISVISDCTAGERLSQVLARAESGGQPVSAGGAAFVVKEILEGMAEFHRQSGDLSHGALAPERIVFADGKVRIADYVLGPAIEQLRFSTERYWKELRVAVPPSAGGARLDRRSDVAQIGMIALALFAGRPLRDSELVSAVGGLLTSPALAQPIRNWLLKALHMDQRCVFSNASEALQSFNGALTDAGLRTAPGDLNLDAGKVSRNDGPLPFKSPVRKSAGISVPPPIPSLPALQPLVRPKRDVWQAHDVDSRVFAQRGSTIAASKPVRPGFRKYLIIGAVICLMTGAFTAAQFIPAPDWFFSQTGTLVIESNPPGVQVLVNGKTQGTTPLTLKVEKGRHEVELRHGTAKIFNVYVGRGDRVVQYIEFPAKRK